MLLTSLFVFGLASAALTAPVNTKTPIYPPSLHPGSQHLTPMQDVVHVKFLNPCRYGGIGSPRRVINDEVQLVLKEWREVQHINAKFIVSYQNRYDTEIESNGHDFRFWGAGVGELCRTEVDDCTVRYNPVDGRIVDPEDSESSMAFVFKDGLTSYLHELRYGIRHKVLRTKGQ
ncbi:hypothetical protein DFJ43DRAFT_154136 [Lentinula guzmanii]|uniref:Uncharacterized protein n=1 Tax=Lentinula guzmanii TaxID=2804957 RepID=A0AA38JPR0_9AGAR|nr:hypothetical protein DFJ43DRAFT_154136 [Lentinula guzmanii]